MPDAVEYRSVGLFAMAFFSLPAGALAHRWGLRRTMLWGTGFAIAFHALLPILDLAPISWREPAILFARGLGNLGITLYSVTALPFLMHITAAEERNRAFSLRTALLPLAGFFGSLIAGLLPGVFAAILSVSDQAVGPYRGALILGSLLCLPALPVMARISDREREPATEAERALPEGPFPWRIFAVMLIVGVLRPSALGGVRTFFNVYLDEGLGMNTAQIGALYSIIWLAAAPVPLLMPRMAKRWGLRSTITVATLGVAASAILMALVPNWVAASIARFGVAGISSINFAALSVFQMALVQRRWRATFSGLMSMAMGLSWAGLSLAGGYVIANKGFPALFLLGAGLALAGVLIFHLYFRTPRGEMTDPNAA